MPHLPTNRTVGTATREQHAADHNELHRLHNLLHAVEATLLGHVKGELADPHPIYLTKAEADELYATLSAIGGLGAHPDLSAHDLLGLATQAELNSHTDAAAPHAGHAPLSHSHNDSDLPASIARDSEVTAAVAGHEGAADPHAGYQKESEKGQANGYASLGADGKVPATQLPAQAAGANEPWKGRLHLAMYDGDPGDSFSMGVGPTPTQIATTKARLALMRFDTALTVANIRWYGVAAVASLYTAAIYRRSDGARLWMGNVDTVANAWGSLTVTPGLVLAADTEYWMAVGARGAGTTAGLQGTAAPPLPRILAIQPGNVAAYGPRFAEAPVTPGTAGTGWPGTLPALTATPAAWAAGFPFFFLDAA